MFVFVASSSSSIYKPEFYKPRSTIAPETETIRGKTNQRPNKPQPGIVYANSADVEVFYPPERAILPHLNGRPRPYDGYRAEPALEAELRRRRALNNRQAQQFREEEVEEDKEAEEVEQAEQPKPKSSGYKYQYDSSVHVPDLIIKKYPYEKTVDNDEEFTHDYEHYVQSLPGDLEKHFGTPDYYKQEQYTVAATENLAKDENCEKLGENGGQTCYICRNPKTGASYEQCAYENKPIAKKYAYGGSKSSKSNPEPITVRHRRSLDFFTPSSYEYFVYGEPNLKRNARQDHKRKTKKYRKSGKKQPKRKVRKLRNPSAGVENPPVSYNGPRYTYEGPEHPYEGPSSPYEGPSSPYEGPSSAYEGPDHDDYYDRTDDRIPYESNTPLLSSFFDDDSEDKKRPQRNPSEYRSKAYSSDYRFGPEFFDEVEVEREPLKRDTQPDHEEFFTGSVKIFKNGDVCEKRKKDSMVCMVCNNDKTGAKYEQCQYSSSPTKKGYTYGSQKSFSSNDRPQRHAHFDQSPEKSDITKKIVILKTQKTFNEEPLATSESKIEEVREEREAGEEDESEVEEEAEVRPKIRETIEEVDGRDDIEGLAEFLGKSKDSEESSFPKEHESYEEYFKRVFPEFDVYKKITPANFDPFSDLEDFRETEPEKNINFEESESSVQATRLKDKPSSIPAQFFEPDDESKKNLAKAFDQFQKRDWSKCKKLEKDKLVCYTCMDENGLKNEECMFVEGSEPVSSHVAYHEKKDYDPAASSLQANTTQIPVGESTEESSKLKGDFEGVPKTESVTTEHTKKRKHPVKKYHKVDEAEERTNEPLVDDSVIRIYFNNTEPSETVTN